MHSSNYGRTALSRVPALAYVDFMNMGGNERALGKTRKFISVIKNFRLHGKKIILKQFLRTSRCTTRAQIHSSVFEILFKMNTFMHKFAYNIMARLASSFISNCN